VLTIVSEPPLKTLGEFPETHVDASKHFHEPVLPPQVAACLRERLRAHYAPVVRDPVPEALLRTLAPLDQTGRASHER
jgi:hypothetical protein